MIDEFTRYQNRVDRYRKEHPEQRYGQAAFNVLYDERPELANQVRATLLDPFHVDERLTAFLRFIEPHMRAQVGN
jgi:hypothetical protein